MERRLMSTAKHVPCPICHKPVALDEPEMPFCSERCRLLDLGNWASEKYIISTPLDPEKIRNQENDEE
jgi:endogenous inhibitor of DNA gyrase (YacG/DUF329 family)